ncbi:MAG: ATP-binding protein [Chloroflexota bacterium]
MTNPTVYFLLGAPGAGKTTWAAAQAARLSAVILASDEIRNELEAQGLDATTENERVFALLEAQLDALLSQGKNVLVDATHARRIWREKEVAIAHTHSARAVAIWFDMPLAVCLQRNERKPGTQRWGERIISPDFLRAVYSNLEPPTRAEFDEIEVIGFADT